MMQAQAQGQAPLLTVRDVSVVFGGIVALNGVSFDMKKGQILGLIGPNGAGKTTLFNCLSRLYQPSQGEILMEGTSILQYQPQKIAEVGIGRTFQNVALFPRLTVRDNIRIGGHCRTKSDFVSDALKLPWVITCISTSSRLIEPRSPSVKRKTTCSLSSLSDKSPT